ncbi:hypothetical protein [Maribacter cobaltidurans]|uniref:hypothetical protein n=1 Tax=Maribacter cobaltidurans TaxID=1178778 RepID=UPI0016638649|nr:hypothetical protein [Maribacter cobaltidurans]GGD76024.1 hypothetical protein GCM10011412_12140 [Maribacter cobaltidurans]
MKSLFSSLLLLLLLVSCSKIEENNDPVIGIWKNDVKSAMNNNKMVIDKEEWIFNDVYLGRFHGYRNDEVTYLTDFKWTIDGNIYTISYPGTDFPEDRVQMIEEDSITYLTYLSGKPFAIRQN